MPNKKYKNANHYRVNSENIVQAPDHDFKVNDDTLFIPESKMDPYEDYDRLMAKLRRDHPKFARYLVGRYNPENLDSMRNFDVIDLMDNEQVPETGAHKYTKEHIQKVRELLNSEPRYASYLRNNICLDIPGNLKWEFTNLIQAGSDEAIDFLIDMGLAVKAFSTKYYDFAAFAKYADKTDFAGRNTLVSNISKLCGIENVIPDVSTAVITNPQNEIVMKGETVKDVKGIPFRKGDWLDQIDPDRHDKHPDFVYPHDNPQCLKSIADLALMYALMGKHEYDFTDLAYHYDEKTGQITDFYLRSVNEAPSFSEEEMEINLPMIDAKAAIALTNIDVNEYRRTLEEQGITGKALATAMRRLGLIREMLENGEIEIVEDWSEKSLKDINKDYSELVKLNKSSSFRQSLTPEQIAEIERKGTDKGLFTYLFYPKQTFVDFHKRIAHCEINLNTKAVLTEPGAEHKVPEEKVKTLTDAGNKKVPTELQNKILDVIFYQTDPIPIQTAIQMGMVSTAGKKFTYSNTVGKDIIDALMKFQPIQIYKPGQPYPVIIEKNGGSLFMTEKPFEHDSYKDPLPAYGLDVRLALSDLYKSHSKHEGATSQEYKDLEHALEAVVLTLEDNPSMNLTKEMLDKAMPDILKKCEAYEKHCMENSVIFGKDKRETRLNVARTLKNIANNYLEGKDSPRADLENDLKERIINTLVTAALQPGNKNEQLRSYAESLQEDKSLRDEVKENLSDSQHFRDLMEKKSASELSKLLTSDTKSFLKEVVSVVDGNKIMQTEVQKHAEKTESLDEAKDLGFTF